jgi:hypothetical protein
MSFRSRVDGILRTALEMRCFGMVGGAGSTGGLTCPPVSGFDPSAADGLAWSNVMSQVSSKSTWWVMLLSMWAPVCGRTVLDECGGTGQGGDGENGKLGTRSSCEVSGGCGSEPEADGSEAVVVAVRV